MARINYNHLCPPPRSIPLLLRFQIFLGGSLSQTGWGVLGFSMIFFWAFAMKADVASWTHFRGTIQTVNGIVSHSENTGFSEGGGKHSKGKPIYANYYKFQDPDGQMHEGVSYSVGYGCAPGTKVGIEFPDGNPWVSRIYGMRTAPFGIWALLVAIFPIVGLFLVYLGLKKGIHANALLGTGQRARGKLVTKEPTGTKINNKDLYKLTFEFEDGRGKTWKVDTQTHEPEALEDEEKELILYNPNRPSKAILLDALPGLPIIDPSGNLQVASTMSALWTLVLPFLTILGNGFYVYWRYMM